MGKIGICITSQPNRKISDVSLIESIPVNKKIDARALYDNELLENSYLNNFNASIELLILQDEQLKTPKRAKRGNAVISY